MRAPPAAQAPPRPAPRLTLLLALLAALSCVTVDAFFISLDRNPFLDDFPDVSGDADAASDAATATAVDYCTSDAASDAQRARHAALLARTTFGGSSSSNSSVGGNSTASDPLRRLAFGSCNMQRKSQPAWHSLLALARAPAPAALAAAPAFARGAEIYRARRATHAGRPVTQPAELFPRGMTGGDVLDFLLHRPPPAVAALLTAALTDAPDAPARAAAARAAAEAAADSAVDQGPAVDAFVWLGDAVYLDKPSPILLAPTSVAEMRATWRRQHARAGYCAFRARVPVVGVWDDHDYGENNGDMSYPDKEPAREMFWDFLDVPQPGDIAAKSAKAAADAAVLLSGSKSEGETSGGSKQDVASSSTTPVSADESADVGAATKRAGEELAHDWARSRASKGKGTYSAETWGPRGQRVTLIMLDVRYHQNITAGDMLGREQWAWLGQQLDKAFNGVPSQHSNNNDDGSDADTGASDVIMLGYGIQAVSWSKPISEGWRFFPQARTRLFAELSSRFAPYLAQATTLSPRRDGPASANGINAAGSRLNFPAWVADLTGGLTKSARFSTLTPIEEGSDLEATVAATAASSPFFSPKSASAAGSKRVPPAVILIAGDIHLAELSHTEVPFVTPVGTFDSDLATGMSSAPSGAPAGAATNAAEAAVLWSLPAFELTTSGMTHAWGYSGSQGHPADSLMHKAVTAAFPHVMNSHVTALAPGAAHARGAVAKAATVAAMTLARTLHRLALGAMERARVTRTVPAPPAPGGCPVAATVTEFVRVMALLKGTATLPIAQMPEQGISQVALWACHHADQVRRAAEQWLLEQSTQYMGLNYATVDLVWGAEDAAATARAHSPAGTAAAGLSGLELPAGIAPVRCPWFLSAAEEGESSAVVAVRDASSGEPVVVTPLPFSFLRPRPVAVVAPKAAKTSAEKTSPAHGHGEGLPVVVGLASAAGADPAALTRAAASAAAIALEEAPLRLVRPAKITAGTVLMIAVPLLGLLVAVILLVRTLAKLLCCCCCRSRQSSGQSDKSGKSGEKVEKAGRGRDTRDARGGPTGVGSSSVAVNGSSTNDEGLRKRN